MQQCSMHRRCMNVGTLRCNVTCDPPQDCHVDSTTIHVMQLANGGPSSEKICVLCAISCWLWTIKWYFLHPAMLYMYAWHNLQHMPNLMCVHKEWHLLTLHCVGVHNTQMSHVETEIQCSASTNNGTMHDVSVVGTMRCNAFATLSEKICVLCAVSCLFEQ